MILFRSRYLLSEREKELVRQIAMGDDGKSKQKRREKVSLNFYVQRSKRVTNH